MLGWLVVRWVRDLPSARFHGPTSSHLLSPVAIRTSLVILLSSTPIPPLRNGSHHHPPSSPPCRETRLHSRTLQMPTPQPASLFGCAGGVYFVMPSLLEPGGRSKMSQARAKTRDGEARRMKASSPLDGRICSSDFNQILPRPLLSSPTQVARFFL